MSTTQYGIGVTKNRFELFEIDDEDPLEVLKIHEQEKEARKKTKLSEKENKGKDPVAKIKPVPARKGIKETQNLKPQETQKGKEDTKNRVQRVDRGERKFNNENREERNNRRVREERPNELNREERSERPERERKEFRGELRGERPSNNYVNAETAGSDGRGRGRGGRGGGFASRGARGGRGGSGPRSNFDSRGKREYDRQSGSDKTGVKSVDKREGSGAHNWGNHRDDIEDMRNSISQPPEEANTWTTEKNENEVVPEANGGVENEETNPNAQDEERRELTLDEWKALKAPRQKPTYNLRKAGEGEDPSQWKKMYALQKKKEGEEEEDEDDYEYESCDYPQRVGRQKHVLDIDIHFKDTRGGGRGRGGRGTGRGGPRMGMRGNSNPPATEKYVNPARETVPKAAPKVDDEHDFPSLGQHIN